MVGCLLSAVLLFFSCLKEQTEESMGITSGISLQIQSNTRTSVDGGTEAENRIDKLGIWFFADGATDTDKALLYSSTTSTVLSGNTTQNFPEELLRTKGMTTDGSYSVYVVANTPAGAAIGGETTLAALKAYTYTATARPNSPFFMSGKTTGAHNFGTSNKVTIPLVRLASRLDITVLNESKGVLVVNKVFLKNDPSNVLLFVPAGSTAPSAGVFTTPYDCGTITATTDGDVTCSGYVYENRSTTPIIVRVEGTIFGVAKTWEAEIKPDNAALLARNMVCAATLRLSPALDVNLSITSWNGQALNGDIHGSLESIPGKVVMDWWMLGKTFTVNIPYNSDNLVTAAVTTPQADWLTGIDGLPNGTTKNGTITLTYTPILADMHPDAVITFTSGKITKTMTVVYDNGLIPVEMLISKGWMATFGLHVAKRGNRIYPDMTAETEDVGKQWKTESTLTPGTSEGTGNGVSNTNAMITANNGTVQHPAANYCRNMGSEWYLSAKNELLVISEARKVFGPSYNLESYLYWSSSAYDHFSYSNAYFVNFNGKFADHAGKENDYSVRCVRNTEVLLTVAKEAVSMDYAALGGSLTTTVDFEWTGTTGTPMMQYTKPTWLTASITTNPSTKTGTLTLTYEPMEVETADAVNTITLKFAGIVKTVAVTYDNGFIPADMLKEKGWVDNLPAGGLHLAKRGNYLPNMTAVIREALGAWKTENTPTPGTTSEEAGAGVLNTNAMIAANNGTVQHLAANYCRYMGSEWYLSTKNELLIITPLKKVFGSSYSLWMGSYWSSSSHEHTFGSSAWNVHFNGYANFSGKAGDAQVRCVRNF